MNPFQLENKNIIITGASSGIGRHFAGVLCEAGANVVLGARREEKIQARVDEIRARHPVKRHEESIRRIVGEVDG